VLPNDNAKQRETAFKVSINERAPATTNQVQSNGSSPQSMASAVQLPAAAGANYGSSTSKSAKEVSLMLKTMEC